jgi:transcriptional regulator with XRE-family HTH domain
MDFKLWRSKDVGVKLRPVPGPVPNSKQLGVAIRERREDQRLTIEQLAAKAGVDTSYLSGIERLGRNPSWNKLARIFAALNIDGSELIERAEQIARNEHRANGELADT